MEPAILIKNGTVVDPANGVDSALNLIVQGGRIAEVTREEPGCGRVIDAAGKCVTPGFIDIHMHEEGFDPKTGKPGDSVNLAMLRMGVTTALGGNCGENHMDPIAYLDQLDREGGYINMGLMAGHIYYRCRAGHTDKYTPLTEPELSHLTALLQEALAGGCMGISFGIRYVPGIDERELLACAALCRPSGKLISAHVRDDAGHVFGAMQELIGVCEALQVPCQVSHIGSMGGFGQMKGVLALIDLCREKQLDVTADCYPYYAFSTGIGETTYDEGFLERYNTDYTAIEICEGTYRGQRCTQEIFQQLRRDAPQTLTVCSVMKPEDVDLAVLHPAVMIASDGLLDRGQGHPRASGTFPRFISRYVRTGRMTLYDAVNKMTALPAAKLGLGQKGRLNKGADADLVIFDPEKIEDRATFDQPMAAPAGIDAVLIGGQIAMDHGEVINGRLVTLLWNFENSVGYPSSDDPKEHRRGLKPFGIQAVEEMNRLGMIIDVSHMSEGGFYDVARYSKKPFAATHSCARALCGHRRNLTDDQLKTLGNAGGIAGVNFNGPFLRDGEESPKIDWIIEHLLYMKDKAGIDAVGFGSDFDGIDDNGELVDYSGFTRLLTRMEDCFTDDEIDKISHLNALRVIRDVLQE